MEATLKAKDDIISTIQAAAGPSRSQTLAHIHKMTPDELKHSLLNKEKEVRVKFQCIEVF
jgi:predicted aconitase